MKERYNMLYTIVSDVYEDKKDANIITVFLDLYNGDEYQMTMDLTFNITNIGLSSDMDYMYDLSKELDRIVCDLYEKKNYNFPSAVEVLQELDKINYLTIEL